MTKTSINRDLTIFEGKETHDFGVRDQKGRAVGAYVVFYAYTFEPVSGERSAYTEIEPGTYFSWTPQATRNGESYGASQSWNLCKTEGERHLAVEKYLKSAKARMAKKFA